MFEHRFSDAPSSPRPNGAEARGRAMTALHRFARDRRGVAAIEFGMILPVMVTLWLGTTEMTFANASDRRLAQAANSVADLVSRQREVDEDVVDGIFEGGKAISYPDGQGIDLQMVVTSVEIDEDGNATVIWSEGHNKAGFSDGAAFELDENLIETGEAGCAVVATARLKQQVVFLSSLFGAERTMEHTFAYRPRSSICVEMDG